MQTMKRNQIPFKYMLLLRQEPILDEWGNETSESRLVYGDPVDMNANISAAGGTAQVEQFGNLTGYDRVIVTADMNCPIDENTVLFIDKEPEFSESGDPLYDYIVLRVAKSLNSISYAVSKVDVS